MSINVHIQPDASLPQPLYTQLADIMRSRITSGFWPAHHKLAAEPDLAQHFGVSRGTLRNAIRLLMREGLLSQVQGRGTFVLPAPADRPDNNASLAGLLRTAGIPFETRPISRQSIESSDFYARMIGSGPYLRYVRLRCLVEGPFTLMENVLSVPVCGDSPEEVRLDDGFYQVLTRDLGVSVSHFRRSIMAIAAPKDAAPLLEVAVGAPVLRIEQVGYLSDGRAFEYATALIRSDRHSLRMTVDGTGQGQ